MATSTCERIAKRLGELSYGDEIGDLWEAVGFVKSAAAAGIALEQHQAERLENVEHRLSAYKAALQIAMERLVDAREGMDVAYSSIERIDALIDRAWEGK